MSSAREQAGEGRLDRLGAEVERGDVPFEMVDRDERDAARPGHGLRRREADEERTDQARTARDADALDVGHLSTRLGECLADDRADELQVAAGGDLRDDAAVPAVEVGLRGDDGGEHPAFPRDDRSGGLVARRLDAQDHAVSSRAPASTRRRSDSRHMITASSRLSV